jgi:hypothetical protein
MMLCRASHASHPYRICRCPKEVDLRHEYGAPTHLNQVTYAMNLGETK